MDSSEADLSPMTELKFAVETDPQLSAAVELETLIERLAQLSTIANRFCSFIPDQDTKDAEFQPWLQELRDGCEESRWLCDRLLFRWMVDPSDSPEILQRVVDTLSLIFQRQATWTMAVAGRDQEADWIKDAFAFFNNIKNRTDQVSEALQNGLRGLVGRLAAANSGRVQPSAKFLEHIRLATKLDSQKVEHFARRKTAKALQFCWTRLKLSLDEGTREAESWLNPKVQEFHRDAIQLTALAMTAFMKEAEDSGVLPAMKTAPLKCFYDILIALRDGLVKCATGDLSANLFCRRVEMMSKLCDVSLDEICNRYVLIDGGKRAITADPCDFKFLTYPVREKDGVTEISSWVVAHCLNTDTVVTAPNKELALAACISAIQQHVDDQTLQHCDIAPAIFHVAFAKGLVAATQPIRKLEAIQLPATEQTCTLVYNPTVLSPFDQQTQVVHELRFVSPTSKPAKQA